MSLQTELRRRSEQEAPRNTSNRKAEISFALDVSELAGSAPDDSFDYSDAISSKSREAKGFTSSAHVDMMDLLEEWEEPELRASVDDEVGALEYLVGRTPLAVPYLLFHFRK